MGLLQDCFVGNIAIRSNDQPDTASQIPSSSYGLYTYHIQ